LGAATTAIVDAEQSPGMRRGPLKIQVHKPEVFTLDELPSAGNIDRVVLVSGDEPNKPTLL
jgi:hypothetical protein